MPPSAPRKSFAPLIRMHVRHSLSLLSNGGRWLSTLSIWGDTITGMHACSGPRVAGTKRAAQSNAELCAVSLRAGDRRAEQSLAMRLGDEVVSATETTKVVTTSKIVRNYSITSCRDWTGRCGDRERCLDRFFELLRLQACVDGCRRRVSPRAGRLWLRRPRTHQTLLRAKSRQRTSRHVPVPDAQIHSSVPCSKSHASPPTFHVLVF